MWDHIVRKLVAIGDESGIAQCDEAYRQLLAEERKVELNAVLGGEGFQTLWPVGTAADD
jgi:hypothetical protein